MAAATTKRIVFIPFPGAGHLFSAVELAKLLVRRERRLSITVFVMTIPGTQSLAGSTDEEETRISYIHLSNDGFPLDSKEVGVEMRLVNYHAPQIRHFIAELTRSESTPLAAIIFDMLCSMVLTDDINDVPRYVYSTSGAANLCLTFHAHNHDMTQFRGDSSTELDIPGFLNSVPANVLPDVMFDPKWSKAFLTWTACLKDAKGILVNTFFELESHAITSLSESDNVPPIYPVGPMINFNGGGFTGSANDPTIVTSWLDNQPQSSVLFVCFGSGGAFEADQVLEIARALECSGTRFLWSLRRSRAKGEHGDLPSNYDDVTEVLPEEFLKRTAEIGKVIGWAPQVEVLAHPAVGGFISHCGWNSNLESVWFGVPIATWPLSHDQQGNAFNLVKEMGIAVELKLDYKKDAISREANYLVTGEEIEKAIRQLMEVNGIESNSLIKKKVKYMSNKSRTTMEKGGLSYAYLDRFIGDVIGNTNLKK